ncbi:unnamed protein product [Coffea canephora]|uniref:Uncharacterized protein n=1 Tax=Coffea canephora TaxID=49390 RepID=A0A068U520_COFCA|nr:unnamed protein product [Coffea canephora]
MKLQPELKKRKADAAPSPRTSSAQKDDNESAKTLIDKLTGPIAQTSKNNLKIQQAKNFAVAQAQQEHCTGNYRIFDSPFGNFLVPVIPTRAELSG